MSRNCGKKQGGSFSQATATKQQHHQRIVKITLLSYLGPRPRSFKPQKVLNSTALLLTPLVQPKELFSAVRPHRGGPGFLQFAAPFRLSTERPRMLQNGILSHVCQEKVSLTPGQPDKLMLRLHKLTLHYVAMHSLLVPEIPKTSGNPD